MARLPAFLMIRPDFKLLGIGGALCVVGALLFAPVLHAQTIPQLPAASIPYSNTDLFGCWTGTATQKCTLAGVAALAGPMVNVEAFGAVPGSTDSTSAFVAARNVVEASGGCEYVPPGLFTITGLQINANNFCLAGAGSSLSTLQRKAGSANALLIDAGEGALGNSAPAYTGIHVSGLTLDGNKANVSQPPDDTTEWGILFTKCSYCSTSDVVTQNLWMGGVGVVINSDYGHFQGSSYNTGQGPSGSPNPYAGLDLESSHFDVVDWISNGDYYGGRMLDNTWGDQFNLTANSPVDLGFLGTNQTVNQSYGNTITLNIIGGAATAGAEISANFRNSIIKVVAEGLTGFAYRDVGTSDGLLAANVPTGNIVDIASQSGQASSAYIAASGNKYRINSNLDGLAGSAGSEYAVDVQSGADGDEFDFTYTDGASFQVRGLILRSGATNDLVSNLVANLPYGPGGLAGQAYTDAGTANRYSQGSGLSPTVASATSIFLLPLGSVVPITGTTTINAITANANGTWTLQFAGAVTVNDASTASGNINLAAHTNYTSTANSTLTVSTTNQGTSFNEVSRSIH